MESSFTLSALLPACLALLGVLIMLRLIWHIVCRRLSFWQGVGQGILLIGVAGLTLACFFASALRDDMVQRIETHQAISIGLYHVEFISRNDLGYRERFFRMTRSDGQTAEVAAGIGQSACRASSIERHGWQLYFVCNGEVPTADTPYIDLQTQMIYSYGQGDEGIGLDQLPFLP